MPGLGAYALAGGVAGLGQGVSNWADRMMSEAEKARERAFRQQENERQMQARREFRAEGWAREDAQIARQAEADANLYTALFGSESGGNFDADNNLGYVGRAQFGRRT